MQKSHNMASNTTRPMKLDIMNKHCNLGDVFLFITNDENKGRENKCHMSVMFIFDSLDSDSNENFVGSIL
jgi:hypothetical protein